MTTGSPNGTGTVIGRYKLLERIGEGGMAVVYMAEQEQPVRRKVAVKIIKPGMDTENVIARFEAERQALALMDHPHIAKIFDGGATETGRPYFVMELVRGVPITEYCDQNQLSTRERLDLFIQVCEAVQHAHQKGIIHRDLKPSNILVTLQDGKPMPKVIDFGIAKATQSRLTEKTLFTRFHFFVGTPAYMSPEQAHMGGLDIDTRADIYALGALLYELLTGRTPFEPKELTSFEDCRRTIQEKEPARPSSRVSTLQVSEITTTAKRQADGASSADSPAPHRPRLDHDEVPGKGSHTPIRDCQRAGTRHSSLSGWRCGRGQTAKRRRTACKSSFAVTRWPWHRQRGLACGHREHVAGDSRHAGRLGAESVAGGGRGRLEKGRTTATTSRGRRIGCSATSLQLGYDPGAARVGSQQLRACRGPAGPLSTKVGGTGPSPVGVALLLESVT